MSKVLLVVGAERAGRSSQLETSCHARGWQPRYLDAWTACRVSIRPDTGRLRLALDAEAELREQDIAGAILVASPTLPAVAAEDLAFQAAECDALLFSLLQLVQPNLVLRWHALAAGLSDVALDWNEYGGHKGAALFAGLAAEGIAHCVFADRQCFFHGASGTPEVREHLLEPSPTLPTSVYFESRERSVVPFAGRVSSMGLRHPGLVEALLARAGSAHSWAKKAAAIGRRPEVVLVGHPGDTTMRHVASVLREEGVRSRHVDLAMCGDNSTSDATYQGALEVIEEAPVAFARCIALHTPRADPVLLKARHRGVLRALERREANTINSPSAAAIALSKASQLMWFSRRGIAVPRTLLTNDAHAARDFLGEVGSVVVKPVSGRRSIVRALAESDVSRLHLLANCPVILQELLGGSSCRVHVVRQYAESIEIRSNALDYREVPGGADYRLCDIPRPLRDSVIEAASELGLWLSGWDLKWHVQQHRWLALEVNRMPAIEYYEHRTDASRVSRALCATLNPSSI